MPSSRCVALRVNDRKSLQNKLFMVFTPGLMEDLIETGLMEDLFAQRWRRTFRRAASVRDRDNCREFRYLRAPPTGLEARWCHQRYVRKTRAEGSRPACCRRPQR